MLSQDNLSRCVYLFNLKMSYWLSNTTGIFCACVYAQRYQKDIYNPVKTPTIMMEPTMNSVDTLNIFVSI
jgi:hypothetical protein